MKAAGSSNLVREVTRPRCQQNLTIRGSDHLSLPVLAAAMAEVRARGYDEHSFRLTALPDGRTRLVQEE
jgi:hypothetical protein